MDDSLSTQSDCCKHVLMRPILLQTALTAWLEKAKTPKLVSLDKKPVNKKALSAIFANQEVPKVIGVLPIESSKIADFQSKLIKLGEDYSDLHVRIIVSSCFGIVVFAGKDAILSGVGCCIDQCESFRRSKPPLCSARRADALVQCQC